MTGVKDKQTTGDTSNVPADIENESPVENITSPHEKDDPLSESKVFQDIADPTHSEHRNQNEAMASPSIKETRKDGAIQYDKLETQNEARSEEDEGKTLEMLTPDEEVAPTVGKRNEAMPSNLWENVQSDIIKASPEGERMSTKLTTFNMDQQLYCRMF